MNPISIFSGGIRKGELVFSILRLSLLISLLFASPKLLANSNILFLEAQAVGSWSFEDEEWRHYSHHPHDAMQKPSIGMDYIGRFGSSTRDWGYVALQFRLAWDDSEKANIQPQLYNAFANLKANDFDFWIGHNKPALGLSSSLDNHALLMMDNSMSGLNFDRDWGFGLLVDRSITTTRLSLTTGSGMPLYAKGNYLLSGRLSHADISRDNYSIGVSGAWGEVLKSMGYEIMHDKRSHELAVGGFDTSLRYLDWELKTDLIYGSYDKSKAYAALGRIGRFLLPEERALWEFQAQFSELKSNRQQVYSTGLMYRINKDFTIRAVYSHTEPSSVQGLALQIYYYKGLLF